MEEKVIIDAEEAAVVEESKTATMLSKGKEWFGRNGKKILTGLGVVAAGAVGYALGNKFGGNSDDDVDYVDGIIDSDESTEEAE